MRGGVQPYLSIHARSEIDEYADTVIRVIFETVD
jgi:hypothetical protein